jgi:hypothetical protein
MPNEDNADVSQNVEKNAVRESSQEQAQESTRSEALNSFSEGQGRASSSDRANNSRDEVAKGTLPELNIFESYKNHMTQKAGGEEQSNHDHSKQEHKHRHGNAGADKPGSPEKPGEKPDNGKDAPPEPEEIVDPNASPKFKEQVDRTNQNVLRGMPEHLRDMMKDVPVNGVKSITHKEGDPINAMHDGKEGIKLAEKREGPAPLETVLKHEYGHEFDMSKGETPHSADPEFRNLIDKAMKDPHMKKHRDQDPDLFHSEVFADLFASNLGARSQHLNLPYADKQFAAARAWVGRKMMEGAKTKSGK